MRKISIILLIATLALALTFTGCGNKGKKTTDNGASGSKETTTTEDTKKEDGKVSSDMVTQFSKVDGMLAYAKEENIGKAWSEMKAMDKSEYYWLYFADKVTVKKQKTVGDKVFFYFELADGNKFWANADNFTSKFIVINQAEVKTYRQPEEGSVPNFTRLQPGDYGVFKMKKNNFIQVEFFAYRPAKSDGERVWVGTKWIKDGYTDDIYAAREAYYLYLAYYYQISKGDVDKAIEFAQKAVDANGGEVTPISNVVKDYLEELQYGN